MRQIFLWALPAVMLVAGLGCSATQKQSGLLSGLSQRTDKRAPATPSQLAAERPNAVQPPSGGYRAQLASHARSAPDKRFQLPKCFASG